MGCHRQTSLKCACMPQCTFLHNGLPGSSPDARAAASLGDAGGEVGQEMWLVSANAGLGLARDLAGDRRHAALRLDPTAAVALRYTSDKALEVLPDALGGAPCQAARLPQKEFLQSTRWHRMQLAYVHHHETAVLILHAQGFMCPRG